MERLFTRREMLRAGAAALLSGPLAVPQAWAAASDFHFLVVSDVHYLNDDCGAWLERAVLQMRALRERPAFCVLAGDLSDLGTSAQLAAVRDIFRPLRCPVHAVLGNHDWLTPRSCAPFDDLFPRARNYVFDCGGWQFIALDSTRGQRVFLSMVPQHTLDWLDETMPKLDRRKPAVVFTHFPLGPNILRPVNAGEVLSRFSRHDLRAVFSGHWHGLSVKYAPNVTLTTGRCCSRWRTNHDGSPERGFLLCSVRDGEVTSRFVPIKAPATDRSHTLGHPERSVAERNGVEGPRESSGDPAGERLVSLRGPSTFAALRSG